ncbi:PAS domain-containing sensor histidine kinase [Pelagibius sp. CAU 1746]|uniref:PAS domain-containing sensor histidine kinase n=1 Tax=Pelagibius sp. CAU 1746 TaxID=3140370 RepID=UPI00325BF3E0
MTDSNHATVSEIFQHMAEAVITIDDGGRIVLVNAAAVMAFGYPEDDIVGQPLDILIPARFRDSHHRHLDRFLGENVASRFMGERGEIIGRRRDGSEFHAEATILKHGDARRGAPAVTAILRDVSERRRWQRQLATSEEKHRAILDACSDAILLADAESGRITDVNARAAELFNCPTEDLLGLHQTELHPSGTSETYSRLFREHIEKGRVLVPEAEIQTACGLVVPVEIVARPTVIGGTPMLVGFFRDISRRIQREKDLREARIQADAANRSKSQFLANVSHELRTPLNAIIGFSEVFRDELLGPLGHEKYVEYAGDLNSAGRQLLEIINDILDMTSLDVGRLKIDDELVDVAEMAEACLRLVRPAAVEKSIELAQEAGPLPALLADARVLRQMLLNLLSNAVKYTPAGGRVTLRAEVGPGGGVELEVADNGIGMAVDQVPHLLEPFTRADDSYTQAQQGTGLGLTLTKRMIEAHGGRLSIVSTPGEGSRISLIFPPERTKPRGG